MIETDINGSSFSMKCFVDVLLGVFLDRAVNRLKLDCVWTHVYDTNQHAITHCIIKINS